MLSLFIYIFIYLVKKLLHFLLQLNNCLSHTSTFIFSHYLHKHQTEVR